MSRDKLILIAVALLAVVAVGWFVVQQARESAARDAYTEYAQLGQKLDNETTSHMAGESIKRDVKEKRMGYTDADWSPEKEQRQQELGRSIEAAERRRKELRDRWESRWLALGLVGPGER